ncbi:MAG: L,D-transpeptidase family protein [Lutimonas sp.]
MTRLLHLLFLLVFLSTPAFAQNPSVEEILESRIHGEPEKDVQVGGQVLFSQIEVPQFYTNRNYELAWTNQKNVRDLLESIESAYDEGLDPEDYHYQRIESLLEKKKSSSLTNSEKADLDLLMTDALILYASHLLEGKLEQSDLRAKWDVEKNARPENVDSLLTVTLHNKQVKPALQRMKPAHYMYTLMKLHLKKLRTEAEEGGWPQVSEGETLKKDMDDPRILEIREFLTATGDLNSTAVNQESLFDEELEIAVKKFQTRHGLTADGAIGKGTIEQMQVPIEKRIEQIKLNLERLRWIFHHPDEDFLIVNIAGFHVRRITDRNEVFNSRVIVGKYHHESPVFKGKMQYIVMNPTWTLPYSIATNETLPKLKKDPGYLAAKHMEVMDRNGKILNASTIDWSQYSRGNFPFIIRQKAGPWNALGEVKFIFPNKYSVYLHDTPSRSLFERQDRAFSHGCIRTEDKWGLLMSLMDDPEVWNMEKINEILESGETTKIDLPEPINIYLVYLTAAADKENNLYFFKDVYKRDDKVARELDKPIYDTSGTR